MMHEFKDYLIDETRLNSKSIAAMHHTLPGIFVSVMKHHFGFLNNKSYETVGQIHNFFIKNNTFDRNNYDAVKDILFKIYRCENVVDSNSLDYVFKKNIEVELYTIIKNLHEKIDNGLTHNQKITENISLLMNNKYRPMTSLRDVDRTYEIGIKFGGDSDEEE